MPAHICCLQMEGDDCKSVDVTAVLLNITEPLETLRKLLESQLGCSLEQFEFWLQDTVKVSFMLSSCCSMTECCVPSVLHTNQLGIMQALFL